MDEPGYVFYFFSFRVDAKAIETNEMRAEIEINFQWKHNIRGGINKFHPLVQVK